MSRWRVATTTAVVLSVAASMLVMASPAQATGVSTATASAGDAGEIVVTWTDDTYAGISSVLATATPVSPGYLGGSCWQDEDTSVAGTCTIENLPEGKAFLVTVQAKDALNGAGNPVGSPVTAVGSPVTTTGKPSAPTGLSATPGNGRIGYSWSASDPNGYAISGYTVYSTPGNAVLCNATAPATSCVAQGLANNVAVTAIVKAVNVINQSDPSTSVAATPTSTSGVANAPTIGALTGLSGSSVSVAFAAGAPIALFPVNSFTASCTSSNGGTTGTASGSTSPVTVSSLTAGKTYTCTVTATNDNGTSSPSAVSNAVTLESVPGAPTNLLPVPGNGQVALSWTAPSGTVSSYDVQYSSNGGTSWTAGPTGVTGTMATVTGLINGTAYIFQVRATNGAGPGGWSTSSGSVTPGEPGRPTILQAIPSSGQVTLSWAAGSPAPTDGYEIERRIDNYGSEWAPATPATSTGNSVIVTSLTNGVTYLFRVRASNGATLKSPWSEPSAPVTVGVAPNVPTAATVTAGPGAGAVTVAWTAPAAGPAPTGYAVSYSTNNVNWSDPTPTGSTATTYLLQGLTTGTPYYIRVRSTIGVLFSTTWASTTGTVTPVGFPGIPSALSGTAGNASVSLTWTAPTVSAANPVTNYRVQYSSNGGANWTAGPTGVTGTSATVTGLTNGTAYVFQVAATNAAGSSAWSNQSAALTPLGIAPPTNVQGVGGNGQVTLSWTAPTPAPTGGYDIEFKFDNLGSTWAPATPATSTGTSVTVTGLTNGTPYLFRVRSSNGATSKSDWALSASVTPAAPVKSLTITSTDRIGGVAVFSGKAVGFAKGDELKVRYRVYNANSGKWSQWQAGGEIKVDKYLEFDGSIDKQKRLKVRVTNGQGVNSTPVTID